MFNLFEFQAIDNGELESMLARSRASAAFRSDVYAYLSSGFAPAIHVEGRAPRVKVVRLIKHVLATLPEFELQRVSVHARSGCSDFIGTVRLESDSELRVFDFVWCCRWRAEEQGWEDAFGLPDQIRAAEEFDWRCFQHWKERAVDDAVALVP
jgi:hypothetical protein